MSSVKGWQVLKIDGHDFRAIHHACEEARAEKKRPTVIIAKTTKGNGVSFLEADTVAWHGKTLSQDELKKAIKELSE